MSEGDPTAMRARKTVLITGGTGFLGRHLALAMKDGWDVVLGARNNGQNMLAGEATGCPVIPMDVARMEAVRDAIIEVRPDVIIHAAATKFVDVAEYQPMECTDVNVTGSQNVARVAMERGVGTVIGISTDKAAPPVRNTYGLTKALMERIFCGVDAKSDTRFACVRYGNVAWSTGSVLPVWRRMAETNGKIGTTGPEMRRFFFTVGEAVRLVQTAVQHIEDLRGQVLSRHMKAAQIGDLLDVWRREFGTPWERIDGRPGERLDEYLIGEQELPFTTTRDFDGVEHYVIALNQKAPSPLKSGLSSANTERLSDDEMVALLNAGPPGEY